GVSIVRVHEIGLKAPGKILEENLVVRAAAHVDHAVSVSNPTRVYLLNAAHAVHKRTPFSVCRRKAHAAEQVVRRDASELVVAVEAAAIDDETYMRKAREWNRFRRCIPSAITLLIDCFRQLAVRDSGVEVSMRNELCRRGPRQSDEPKQRQHSQN